MKKIVKHMTEKKFTTIAGIVMVLMVSLGIYTVVGIGTNVKEIAATPAQTEYNFATYPTPSTAGKDPEVVKRGEYLVKAGDCIACHTNSPEKGTPFAGGLPMQTPFGTIYSPNITPDLETGIGKWTDEQFVKAMRHGVSPEGHYYYPAFPYYYFNHISDEDLQAIRVYLQSIPAIHQVNRPNKMVPPFNQRILQFGWRFLFFRHDDSGPLKNNPQESTEWNRGAYLVESLGHCAMCHSPSYHIISDSISLGAPIQKYNLTGAKIQGYLAPNISKANLNEVSTADIMNVFLKDELIGGGHVEGPMLEVNHDSLSYMTQEDLLAIATYLKSVQSKAPPKPSGGAGEATYEGYCSGCHAMGSGGAPKMGDADAWAAIMKKSTMDQIYSNAIHGLNGMPAKGTCMSCSDDDIKKTVDYMIHGGSSGSNTAGTPMLIPKPLTMEQAQQAYEKDCSSCHANSVDGAPKPGDDAAWQPIIAQGFFNIYMNVTTGRNGHPVKGVCVDTCTDADVKAAIKYMLQQSSKTNNYDLW
ncbi:MAG: c-type cytochrome [Pseudomonadota bacterium]